MVTYMIVTGDCSSVKYKGTDQKENLFCRARNPNLLPGVVDVRGAAQLRCRYSWDFARAPSCVRSAIIV